MSSSAGAGSSKRRGQYSSRACNECRRRRCKCDGLQPICATCASFGRECDWSTDSDARRPVTKQLVESLRVKIQLLEAEVERLRLSTGITALNYPLPESPSNLFSPLTSPSEPFSGVQQPNQNFWELNTLLDFDDIPDVECAIPPTTHFATTVMYRYIFHIDNTVPAHQQSDDIRLSLVCDWSRYLPPLPGITFSRQEHDLLLLRCFKYGTSWLLGLVPELFLHDMLYSLTSVASKDLSQPRLQHYSPLLHCSIMAFAAAFSDDPAIRAPATRARFASWAKQWLDDEFKYPVMSLVRALALLAEYHCGVGEKDAGYMFLGMSFRAVRLFDLKSDSDVTSFDDVITLSESNNPNWHFWSLFSYDKFMAIEHNIDYDIPIPNSGVVLPSVDDELDNQYWMPEPASTSSANTPSIKLTTITFHQSCKLMMIATRIIDVVRHQQKNLVEEHVVVDAHLRLDTWFNGLPEKLLIRARSASPLPYVIVLHMCYWWLLIALYQPFYQKEPLSGQEAQRMPIADLSIKICDRAAHKIVQLITMFEGSHGKRTNAANGINTCVNALRIVSTTWPCAQVRADDLQSRLGQLSSSFSIMQLDGIGGDPSDDVPPEQDMDDAEDISNMFHQYMHEWGHMPD